MSDAETVYQIMVDAQKHIWDKNAYSIGDMEYVVYHIRDNGFTLVAEDGDNIVGFLMVDIPGLGEDNLGYDLDFTEQQLMDTAIMESAAVLPEYQGRGYGQRLFNAVYHKYCGMFDGLLLCADRVDTTDPVRAEEQRRLLAFYKKAGAHVLQAEFLLPTEDGGYPMHLLFKPKRGLQELSRESQLQMVRDMFEYCYGHIKHRHELFQQFKDTIADENFLMRE